MKTNEDFRNVDQAASESILKEFKGKQVEETCPDCKGSGKLAAGTDKKIPCENYQGTGAVLIEY